MKAILISIKPKWCELIKSGKKTIEIRKNAPRLKPPFKCYIYECKGKRGKEIAWWTWEYEGSGKVIGEFVCDSITKAQCGNYGVFHYMDTMVTTTELLRYANREPLYGFHISDLVIYDEPKNLNDFHKVCEYKEKYGKTRCKRCGWLDFQEHCNNIYLNFNRPPQSWCYAEVR